MPDPPPRDRREPPKPTLVPGAFMSDDAEAEIRRNVTRHYQQIAEIETLKNDAAHWRHRAELSEAEVLNLQTKIVQLETAHEAERHSRNHEVDDLKEIINTLQAQFEAGARIWLSGYDILRRFNPKLVTPQQLTKGEDDDEVHRDSGQ
jgi:hypothetical protein